MSRRSIQYGVGMAVMALAIVSAVVWHRVSPPVPSAEPPSIHPVSRIDAERPASPTVGHMEREAASYSGAERPLPSAQESATHAWTDEDARRSEIIEQIAHNPAEVERMVEENDRILRRQLVYRKDPAALVVQRSIATGEPIRQLILPGLDGRELVFMIDHADLSPSGQSGSFQGHLADWPDSMVTLAFKFGREAFSVSSPWDNLYLEAEPREPGQVIIKEIDPDTYVTAPCGTPDFIANNEGSIPVHTPGETHE